MARNLDVRKKWRAHGILVTKPPTYCWFLEKNSVFKDHYVTLKAQWGLDDQRNVAGKNVAVVFNIEYQVPTQALFASWDLKGYQPGGNLECRLLFSVQNIPDLVIQH